MIYELTPELILSFFIMTEPTYMAYFHTSSLPPKMRFWLISAGFSLLGYFVSSSLFVVLPSGYSESLSLKQCTPSSSSYSE